MYPYMPIPDPLYLMYLYSWWMWLPLYYMFGYIATYMMLIESYKLFFDAVRRLFEQLKPS